MSRSIDIWYEDAAGTSVDIEVRPPYYLLGGQQTSKDFWSIPRLTEIGIERLTILGESDPIGFWGWDDLALLEREIDLFRRHFMDIDFNPELKASWLSHLTYCYHLLRATAPQQARPVLTIG
jgi:hypothetical protein